ncbi:cytochrome P450 76T24-like [Arachis duranensis]|uniref:Cytochrome P450 76T24-like n=1 Tax=Arachis duranensis TaxID=130453 RepID=A0A6P5N2H0_ARADU|nr:cytochrome P450 76T24-like [Arachis duranensis]
MECYNIFEVMMLLIIILKLVLVIFNRASKPTKKMPPGPYPYPIIGNILELGQKPHQSLFNLSKLYGPLMTLKLGSLNAIVISSPEIAKEALTKHDLAFSNREVPDITRALDHHKVSLVWSPICDHWRTLRKLCATNIFSPQKLESTSKLRHKKVQELVDFLRTCSSKGEAIDIGEVVFTTIMNSLSNTLFSMDFAQYGSRDDGFQNFKGTVESIMVDAGKANVADLFPLLRFLDPQGIRKRGDDVTLKLLKVFGDIFDERMLLQTSSNKNFEVYDDVLDSFINIIKENSSTELSRHHLLHLFVDLFVAGIETTTSTTEWAMTELVHNPKMMARVKEELLQVLGKDGKPHESNISEFHYLNAIVKETFRLHPPVPFLHHKSKSMVEICGFKVPKDTQVLINLWAIGRNSSTWSDPNSFVPERFIESKMDVKGFDFGLIPFGAGRRMCPALPLAHRTVHFILASLLHYFDWKIVNGMKPQELDMSERYGLTIRKAQPLNLIPIHVN